ncbi:MAG: V-type ATP synthase subunit K [Brevinema sp.]
MTVVATPGIWGSVNWGLVFAVLGAAFATFTGGYGSSIGVGVAGEVGNAVLTEDGKKFGSVLILQALPMTQGIYGLLYAFMVLGAVNDLDLTRGLQLFFASLPVGICGLISGIWQGKVSAAGMQLIARRPKQMGQALILPAMVETFAVFGLLASILLMNLGR